MAKGGAFERKVAKELSLWWSHGERDDIFWRSSASGARATQRRKVGKKTANQDGDLAATDPIGQPLIDLVTIELKKGYNEMELTHLLSSKQGDPLLLQFIRQCEREAAGSEKGWWLIICQDRRKTLLIYDSRFCRTLKKAGINWHQFDAFQCTVGIAPVFFAMRYNDFLNLVQPEDLLRGAKC